MAFWRRKKDKKDDTQAQAAPAVAKQPVAEEPAKTEEKSQVAETKTEAVAQPVTVLSASAEGVIIRPVVTEKASAMNAAGKYVFEVSSKANKVRVRQAIKEIYGVRPDRVQVINVSGKKVRFGRSFGQRRDWKKAIVTLPKDKKIEIYKGV